MSTKAVETTLFVLGIVCMSISVIIFGYAVFLLVQHTGDKPFTLPKWSWWALVAIVIGAILMLTQSGLRQLREKKEKRAHATTV